MIIIKLDEIKKKFNDLITEKSSREEISDWAIKMQRYHDDDQLIFEPPQEKTKIWKGLSYLTGVDLPDLDRQYLHCKEDFIEFKKNLFEETHSD